MPFLGIFMLYCQKKPDQPLKHFNASPSIASELELPILGTERLSERLQNKVV